MKKIALILSLFLLPSCAFAKKQAESMPPRSAQAQISQAELQHGAQVFIASGCSACHTIKTLEGAVGELGPVLDHFGQRAASRKNGLSARAYTEESINAPEAFLVEGYANMMPSLRYAMSDEEYQHLLTYLLSL